MKFQRKFFTLILFLLIAIKTYSQTTTSYQYLDERNGFKIFTFGDAMQKYEGMINEKSKYLGFLSFNTKAYKYTKSEPYELFGLEWNELYLGFTRKKLTRIKVAWKFNKRKFLFIKAELAKIFGEPKKQNSFFLDTYYWKGDKILMKLIGVNDNYIKDGMEGNETISLTIENTKLEGYILYNRKKDF